MDKWHSPGLAVGILKGDTLAWSGYFGYANLKEKQPVSAATEFLVGSISKTITAAALMQLYELGKFKLTDPVNQYAPYPIFRQKRDCNAPVSFLEVFTHTSGGGEYLSLGQYLDPFSSPLFLPEGMKRKSLDRLYRHGIHTGICPGTKYAYCNYCVGALRAGAREIERGKFRALHRYPYFPAARHGLDQFL